MNLLRHVILLIFVFSICLTNASSQNYFQQKANYKINAELDTLNQTLKAHCILSYTNNSSDKLDFLFFHLWWNAYGDKQSAYANQTMLLGDMAFFFANEDQMGGYSEISFESGLEQLEFEFHKIENKEYKDIVKVNLTTPLEPGETREIIIDYIIEIPFAFSRGGYAEDLYRMAQWYPKPAVYDIDGWHPMPYLEYGEYYSEFGDYDVELTVPVSYSIASTGLIDESKTEYQIKERKRVLHIRAENVHDFAWFASENYVPYSEIINVDEKEIRVIIFASVENEEWEKMMSYAKRAIQFYSEEVAPYPYPQVTIVEEQSGKNGGMEYPMITLIDNSLDEQILDHLIAHEIGHNWFYGILASNERDHTWMDEGLNSFYEHKYNDKYYLNPAYNFEIPNASKNRNYDYSLLKGGVMCLECMRRTQKIDQASQHFDPINYVSMNYEKMSWAFEYLESYLGEDVFQKCVQQFYNDWSFKHPGPKDIKAVFENISEKDLSWFFEDLIETTSKFDYAIKKSKNNKGEPQVLVTNRNELSIPFAIASYDENDQLLTNDWHQKIPPGETIEIEWPSEKTKKVIINGENIFIDINRNNNQTLLKGGSGRPLNINFLGGLQNSNNRQVFVWPSIFLNEYDGLMLGANFSNGIYPVKTFRWVLNPTFGFKSKDIVGLFALEKDFALKEGHLRKWTVGIDGRRFNYLNVDDIDFDYFKLAPSITAHFSKGIFKNASLQYKLHYINREELGFTNEITSFRDASIIHQLNYRVSNKKRLSQNDLLVQLEYEKYDTPFDRTGEYLKMSLEYNKKIYYNKNSRLFLRFFGGYFPINSARNSSSFASSLVKGSIALTSQGYTDHTFEEFYFARSGTPNNGGSSSQITIAEGGFKNTFEGRFPTGFSNDYATAINLKIDLPFSLFKVVRLRPYMDLAYLSTKEVTRDPLEGQFLYSGGISLEMGSSFGVYLPLINSSAFKSNYSGSSLFSRISFQFNFRAFNPWALADKPGVLLN